MSEETEVKEVKKRIIVRFSEDGQVGIKITSPRENAITPLEFKRVLRQLKLNYRQYLGDLRKESKNG